MMLQAGEYFHQGDPRQICQIGGQPPDALILVNEQGQQSRCVMSMEGTGETLVAIDWGQMRGQVHPAGLILWSNGSVWTRRPFPECLLGTWLSLNNIPCQINADGGGLVFVNDRGQPSRCQVMDPGTLMAVDWNMPARIGNQYRSLNWANGMVWMR